MFIIEKYFLKKLKNLINVKCNYQIENCVKTFMFAGFKIVD